MSERKSLIPEFGPFSGMRVIGTGSLIAMPFAASMLADFGAEVITIERPGAGDTYRTFPPFAEKNGKCASSSWVQDARNRLSMTLELDLSKKDAKEIFFGLIKQSDVYIENMVWIEKMGIVDEELLEVNPKLIIVHISGFGNKRFGGVPEMCQRASYDMIGQAFSGYVLFNGYPDRPPLVVKPSLNDYITSMFALFGIFAAYMGSQKTGKGQIVDVAQFEAQAKLMRDAFTMASMGLGEVTRCGTRARGFQPWDLFLSSDESYVAVGVFGPHVFHRFMEAAGFDESRYPFEKVSLGQDTMNSALGREFSGKVEEWFRCHTAGEIDEIMSAYKVPCSKVNTAQECMEEPQFLLRDDFVTYRDQTLDTDVTAFGIAPKLSGTPGRVWRGAPYLGQDTDRILRELLSFDDERIARLHSEGIV